MEILQHSATFFIRKIACLFSFYSIVQVFSFSFFGVGVFGRGCGVIRYICNVNECRNPSKATSFTNFLGFVTCYCSFLCKIVLFKLLCDEKWFFFPVPLLVKGKANQISILSSALSVSASWGLGKHWHPTSLIQQWTAASSFSAFSRDTWEFLVEGSVEGA